MSACSPSKLTVLSRTRPTAPARIVVSEKIAGESQIGQSFGQKAICGQIPFSSSRTDRAFSWSGKSKPAPKMGHRREKVEGFGALGPGQSVIGRDLVGNAVRLGTRLLCKPASICTTQNATNRIGSVPSFTTNLSGSLPTRVGCTPLF